MPNRPQGGKRQGKAPIELLTGEALEADRVDLLIQHKREATPDTVVAPAPSLDPMPHSHEGMRQVEIPASHVVLDGNADSDHPGQDPGAKAA